jgi:hypothetical protein
MVCHEAGNGSERPRACGWLITTPSPYRDELDTLPGGDIADGAARLTPKLHRFDTPGQRPGQLLCFGECIGTTLELGLDQFALAMRWQLVPTRAVPYQIEPSPRTRTLDVDKQELRLVKAQQARQRIQKLSDVESVHERENSHRSYSPAFSAAYRLNGSSWLRAQRQRSA